MGRRGGEGADPTDAIGRPSGPIHSSRSVLADEPSARVRLRCNSGSVSAARLSMGAVLPLRSAACPSAARWAIRPSTHARRLDLRCASVPVCPHAPSEGACIAARLRLQTPATAPKSLLARAPAGACITPTSGSSSTTPDTPQSRHPPPAARRPPQRQVQRAPHSVGRLTNLRAHAARAYEQAPPRSTIRPPATNPRTIPLHTVSALRGSFLRLATQPALLRPTVCRSQLLAPHAPCRRACRASPDTTTVQ